MRIPGSRPYRAAAGAVLAAGLAVVAGAASRQDHPANADGPAGDDVRRSECYLAGLPRAAECVSVDVPLDWEVPEGERIEVTAVVVRAVGERRPEPLFVLPGGPGQGASRYGGLVSTAFSEIHKHRDIVLVDPRGTGLSTPFDCHTHLGASAPLSSDQRVEVGRSCAAGAPADPRFFTAREVVEDIDRLRSALGYDAIDLWGGSFGTRLAQYYVAAHGDRVRAAIFDAPVPTATILIATAGADAERTVDSLYARCAADTACAGRFPRGKEGLAELLESFDTPRPLHHSDPLTDSAAEGRFDRDAVTEMLRGALYVPTSAVLLPLVVDALAHGDATPLAALAAETAGWSTSTQQMGALLAIMCSEEAAELGGGRPLPDARSLFGDGYPRFFLDFCKAWPTRPLPPSLRYPAGQSQVPALVLSGVMDPVADPRRGEELAALFSTHVNLVVRNGGHINSARGCAPRLLSEFLDDPGAPVDGSCLDDIAWPPFALSPLGPVAPR